MSLRKMLDCCSTDKGGLQLEITPSANLNFKFVTYRVNINSCNIINFSLVIAERCVVAAITSMHLG